LTFRYDDTSPERTVCLRVTFDLASRHDIFSLTCNIDIVCEDTSVNRPTDCCVTVTAIVCNSGNIQSDAMTRAQSIRFSAGHARTFTTDFDSSTESSSLIRIEISASARTLQFVDETDPEKTITAARELFIFRLIEKPSNGTIGALIHSAHRQ
jgi:hypothetical protein